MDYSIKKQNAGQAQKTSQDLPVDYSLKDRKAAPDPNTIINKKTVPPVIVSIGYMDVPSRMYMK